jgi:DNA mismatch repair protein MutS2
MLLDPCPDKTRADLEWDRLLGALAERCAGPAGKRLAQRLPFATSHEGVVRALSEVREAVALESADTPLPMPSLPDLAGAIERARIGAALAIDELRGVAAMLAAARALRRFLHLRREECPALFAACAFDPSLDDLLDVLAGSFDPDGSLSDRASPRLGELRAERKASRDRLVRRLEELTKKHEGILQDRYWTERDGRYVLPVRSDAHERFPGIVHATSDSGATIFVEPRALVPMGNRQKMLQDQVTREEHAILLALSARVTESIDSVAAAAEALAHGDVRRAGARLSADLDLRFPEVLPAPAERSAVGAAPTIELRAARHPLLQLDGVAVVPSDLTAHAGRALVVSGPNAGGKTVALKTMGLAALMVRAGLPVPAADGSRMAVFEVVLTDVGDDQNLSKNLSTFSAHVQNLAGILDATRPGALVLLDELAGGTDPREGEALAAGVLDSLCARGGTVACTTHYEGLKVLAQGDGRFENASVGFDLATMAPTFRLAIGIPGASSALAVARRYGIPSTVIERAESFLSTEVLGFDKMVETLAAERRALELARADAEREAEAARQLQRDLDAELVQLRSKERIALSREGETLMQSLRRAREDLRGAQARLRASKPTEEELRAAARVIDTLAQKTAIGGELEPRAREEAPARRALGAGELRVGARVWVPRLRAEAEVIEVMAGGQLRVAAGPLKLAVAAADVLSPEEAPRAEREAARPAREARVAAARGGGGGRGAAAAQLRSSHAGLGRGAARATQSVHVFDPAADDEVPMQTSDNTVDLRGLRAHEALGMAEQFLDRSIGAGRRVAFLIHGHGTGALRDTLRESLQGSRYVARMRPGGPREGGDGVTVIWLR